MKKIYAYIESLITHHSRIAIFLAIIMMLASGIAAIDSNSNFLSNFLLVVFFFSICSMFRIISYKNGKIPFFMKDTTWENYRLQYPEYEAKEKYKKTSIKRATTYFFISAVALAVWIIFKVLSILFT